MGENEDRQVARWAKRRARLRSEIERHTGSDPGPFYLTEGHGVVVSVLRDIAYGDARVGTRGVRFRLDDHTVLASEFPAGALQHPGVPPDVTGLPVVRLGTMSQRHLDLDYLVDGYLVRNVDVSGKGDASAQASVSYASAYRVLRGPGFDDGAEVHVYHTGLVPMIVGVYMAVAHVLCERRVRVDRGPLVVVPRLYTGEPEDGYVTGTGPGSDDSLYVSDRPWW